jgi:Heparinase II/III-like protein/Heparinase II/III N-terminus
MVWYRRVVDDVRALGTSAPVRAAYEVSKRTGFHSVLFGVCRPLMKIRSTPVQIGNLVPLSTAASGRTLEDAKLILADGLRVFGRRVPTGISEPWSCDPESGRQWPASTPWWQIDIRSEHRLGDVKYVWEAARHRDLVVLARAACLEPDGPWATSLNELLQSWCEQNKPEHGVNWYSSLELSLRAIAWSQVLSLAGDRLEMATRVRMDEQLLASARHLMVELPYTLSSMKNNHLLGDALGLIVLARLFPHHRAANRWKRVGERLFSAQLRRHMRTDGSMIEDSLSYHRFVLEMLVVRTLLGDAPDEVVLALRGASRHLAAIGVFQGDVPQYGDWDEGRVLATSSDPLAVTGSAALGLVLTGDPVPLDADFDELAWYAPARTGASDVIASTSGSTTTAVSGGMAYTRRGPWRVWFKVGSAPSHGHADLTSVWIEHEGRWLVSDPGTGTYNGPLIVRNGFRTSSAHPVLRINGRDQLGPHRAFRWLRAAHGHLAPPATIGDSTILFGWHDAYQGPDNGLRVARAVVINEGYVAVVDALSSFERVPRLDLTLPLGPGIHFSDGLLAADNVKFTLFGADQTSSVSGNVEEFTGWTSRTYGAWQPATWVTWSPKSRVSMWGIGEAPHVGPGPGDEIVIDSLHLRVRWATSGAALEIAAGHDDPGTVLRA